MSNVCLLPEKVAEFRKALKERDIKIQDLLNMDSDARTEVLKEYAGKNAADVNSLFESKLVLKNRMLGLKNWASKLGEIGRYSEEGKAALDKSVSEYRAAQQERIFSPKENESFLSSLAEKQLGTQVTKEEAANVFDLSKVVSDAKEKGFDDTRPRGQQWESPESKANYGAAKYKYESYISQLKGEGEPFTEVMKGRLQEFKNTAATNPAKAVFDVGKDALKTISDNAIAIVASVDNSFIGRQGLKTLLTSPSAWWPGAKDSFANIFRQLGGKDAMEAIMADYYSRENNINGEYEKSGVIPVMEEQYPTSLPERIPGLGKVFKASEVAFKGSALRIRMDLYDLQREMQQAQGIDMEDPAHIRDTGKVTNSLTARGKFGKYGESPIVKLLLWAPRMLKSNYDILTAHSFGAGLETDWARKQAALNVTKIVGSIGLMLTIANAINKNSVEKDPTSSNFGNILLNDTKVNRIIGTLADFVGLSSNVSGGKVKLDITGGMNSLVTLAARQIEGASKSAVTGIKSEFGSGFGQTSRFESLVDFLTGKTAPAVKVAIDFAKGENASGKKPTLLNELEGLSVPISIQNILGIGKTQGGTSWDLNPSAELIQFKQKVGDQKFKEANDLYNQQYTDWLTQRKSEPNNAWNNLDDTDKQRLITNAKSTIKSAIFKKYGFKYAPPKSKPLPKI